VTERSTATLRRPFASDVTRPILPLRTQLAAVKTTLGESSVPEQALVATFPLE
jgi:hypothetical protein